MKSFLIDQTLNSTEISTELSFYTDRTDCILVLKFKNLNFCQVIQAHQAENVFFYIMNNKNNYIKLLQASCVIRMHNINFHNYNNLSIKAYDYVNKICSITVFHVTIYDCFYCTTLLAQTDIK